MKIIRKPLNFERISYVTQDHFKLYMKELGSNIGGRVFFVQSDIDSESVITYLESAPVLVQRR